MLAKMRQYIGSNRTSFFDVIGVFEDSIPKSLKSYSPLGPFVV
jgi:hypothetical protein